MNIYEAQLELGENGFFKNWISKLQRNVLTHLLQGEEGGHFAEILTGLKMRIETMPKTYETDHLYVKDKVLHLHYFIGGVDAWIVERDVGDSPDGDGLGPQIQTYGKQGLFDGGWNGAEWGFISIQELIDNNANIDLYFTPRQVKEMR